MYQHILIALEGKPSDEAAIALIVELFERMVTKITLLRVITSASDGQDELSDPVQTKRGSLGWGSKDQARELLGMLEHRFRLSGQLVDTALIVGDRGEGDEIVAFAEEGEFDLIVMAADERPLWQRAAFGSPSETVLRKACLPTLFVSGGTGRERVAEPEKVIVHHWMAALSGAGM